MVRRAIGIVSAAAGLLFAGEAIAQASPSPYTTGYRYDDDRRLVGTISADPDGPTGPLPFQAVRNTYDTGGRLIKVENGTLAAWQSEAVLPVNWQSNTTFTVYTSLETTYDILDRKLTETTKGSDGMAVSLTQFSYDLAGRLECTALRMNPATYGSLPSSACTLGAQGSYGSDRITRNVYDAAGQLLQVREGVGSGVESAEATYSYTANGKKQQVVDANGNRAELRYDGHDRQVRWVFPSGARPAAYDDATPANAMGSAAALSEGDYEAYAWDANGNRTSLRKRDGSTLTYSYDALNRNTVKVVPERSGLAATHTRDVYYGHDLQGRQMYARFDSASGEGISNVWDGLGRLTSTTQAMDGTSRTLSYQDDANGNRTQLTWMDGAATSFAYDGLNRLATIYEGALGSTVNMVSYGYDASGRPTSQNGRYGANMALAYDAASRLNALSFDLAGTGADQAFTFTFNPASQIASRANSNDAYAWTGHVNVDRAYTANGLNQYTAAGSASFTYDANGNLTSDGTNTYTYDVENRLVAKSGAASTTLRYDPLGRLYEILGTTEARRLLNDGDALVAEYNFNAYDPPLRRFVHGVDSGDDPVLWYEGPSIGPARWLHRDWQGSIAAVSDSSTAMFAINRYDEFGIPQAGNVGRFQYTGQAWLPDLGLYYYKARMYSPTLGRFMQTDPIGYDDQINLYAYVGNDPVNSVDPSGRESNEAERLRENVVGAVNIALKDMGTAAKVGPQVVKVSARNVAEGWKAALDKAINPEKGQESKFTKLVVKVESDGSISSAIKLPTDLRNSVVQPEKVTRAYKGDLSVRDQMAKGPTPRTKAQKIMEVIRNTLDIFGKFRKDD